MGSRMLPLNRDILWLSFGIIILVMLILDLGAFHRRAHAIRTREALIWSCIWITIALLFNAGVYLLLGKEKALEFLTAYILEKSLSVDNLFVFLVIFNYFNVKSDYQHRVLYWGILGALVMRGIIIFTGTALLHRFSWLEYFFGAFLVYTAIKFALEKEGSVEPEQNPFVRLYRRLFPVTREFEEEKFFLRQAGKLIATPMFIVLLVIESSDLIFAVDSIPAVLSVSHDSFIVYSSNIFAILGLRALYFLLAAFLGMFRYLKPALAIILGFIGVKMLLSWVVKIPTALSLALICVILTAAVLLSVWKEKKEKRATTAPPSPDERDC
jgi:tellurite resistance protein TerC